MKWARIFLPPDWINENFPPSFLYGRERWFRLNNNSRWAGWKRGFVWPDLICFFSRKKAPLSSPSLYYVFLFGKRKSFSRQSQEGSSMHDHFKWPCNFFARIASHLGSSVSRASASLSVGRRFDSGKNHYSFFAMFPFFPAYLALNTFSNIDCIIIWIIK